MATQQCRCRYTVESHMAGYMPDSEPDCYRTLSGARSGAQFFADSYRQYPEYKVTGNQKTGYTVLPLGLGHPLPTYINIHDVGECGCNNCDCESCQ